MGIFADVQNSYNEQDKRSARRLGEQFHLSRQRVYQILEESNQAQRIAVMLRVLLREVEMSQISPEEMTALNQLLAWCQKREVEVNLNR